MLLVSNDILCNCVRIVTTIKYFINDLEQKTLTDEDLCINRSKKSGGAR
jgi:hypothetical protein